ncbi:hypothetical protein AB2N04_10995 [Nitratireductor sp. GISD-1A_MAKvit]|uniref:DUF7507 domain-containing protein n=1 Tax=Nitratireductor sp. GISD-1A_MAKvit TaxID=3234198 RepID=UPI003465EFE0
MAGHTFPSLDPEEKYERAELSYYLTQADIDAGEKSNDASVTAITPDDTRVSDRARTTFNFDTSQSISLTKRGAHVDANGNGVVDADDHIQYTFVVENTGDVTLRNITVADEHLSSGVIGGPLGSLGPRQVDDTTFSGRYELTQADVDAGVINNTASVKGVAPDNEEVTDTSSLSLREDGVSAISLDKTGAYVDTNGNGRVDPGDRIEYKFEVQNSGTVTLSDITVSDKIATVSGGPLEDLAVGAKDTTTFSAFYELTQDLIDAGEIDNEATVTGKDPRGNSVSDGSKVKVMLETSEAISLDKTAEFVDLNTNGRPDAGDRIDYSFRVENTGDVTLKNVTISDPPITVTGAPLPQLLPSASNANNFSGSYTIKQADVDAGEFINTATARGVAPDDGEVTDTGKAEVELTRQPGLKLTKNATYEDVNGNSRHDPGDRLNYTFIVENTGNVTIENITIDDPKVDVTGGPIGSLAPGAVDGTTFRAQYEITQPDIDLVYFVNTATVSGRDPQNKDITSDGVHEFFFEQKPSLTFEKSGVYVDTNANSVADVGDHINYTFKVTNTGNVTLFNTIIDDPDVVLPNNQISDIPPGDTAVRNSAPYAITQADIDAGQVVNEATVTTETVDQEGLSATDNSVVPLAQVPGLTLEKKEDGHEDKNGNGVVDAGDAIKYRFEIENSGNVTLKEVTLSDPKADVSGAPVTSLAPGAKDTTTFTAEYTLTQADLDAGKLTNTATASATTPDGKAASDESTVELLLSAAPAALFIKSGELVDTNGSGRPDVGDVIEYRFLVRNTGNVSLKKLRVADDLVAVTGGTLDSLAPGEVDNTTFEARYEITQEDIQKGQVENTAKLHAEAPSGDPLEVDSQNETGVGPTIIMIEGVPDIDLSLEGVLIDANGNGFPDAGERVEYSFIVTNTGNITLSNVSIPSIGLRSPDGTIVSAPVAGGPLATLGVGAEDSGTFTASHVLTQDQIEQKLLFGIAQVSGFGRARDEVTAQSEHQLELPQNASLALVKTAELDASGDSNSRPGDLINYEFVATNDGNVRLEGVVPKDPGPSFRGQRGTGSFSSFTPESASLEPGASATFRAQYAMTQEDIDRARNVLDSIKNTATVSGRAGDGKVAVSPEAEAVINLPGVIVSKTTDFPEVHRGDIVPYTLKIHELGRGRVASVNLIDYLPKGFSYVSGSARVSDTPVTPKWKGRRLVLESVRLSPDAPVVVTLQLLVTSAAVPGEYVNSAWAETSDGERISPIGTAAVDVVPETVFDCSDVVGKVFDDKNRNGYQDDGEIGVPGARVAAVDGLTVTSDAEGRFSVACAELPEGRIGQNYSLKLDPRSLPTGYRITTENPRVIRLTSGKVSRANFGVSIGRVARLDIDGRAFEDGGVTLGPRWQNSVTRLINLLEQEPTVLRLVYVETDEGGRLARRRLASLRREIDARWRRRGGRYELLIETVRKRAR